MAFKFKNSRISSIIGLYSPRGAEGRSPLLKRKKRSLLPVWPGRSAHAWYFWYQSSKWVLLWQVLKECTVHTVLLVVPILCDIPVLFCFTSLHMPTSRNARCFCFWLSGEYIIFFFLLTKKCTNSCPVWPLKKKILQMRRMRHAVYLFFCISLCLCRARSRSLLSAAVSMTWTPWSAPCHPPHRRLRHPSPRALCRLYRPQQAPPLRDSSPTQTNSARSSMSWWRRRRLTSKSVQFFTAQIRIWLIRIRINLMDVS